MPRTLAKGQPWPMIGALATGSFSTAGGTLAAPLAMRVMFAAAQTRPESRRRLISGGRVLQLHWAETPAIVTMEQHGWSLGFTGMNRSHRRNEMKELFPPAARVVAAIAAGDANRGEFEVSAAAKRVVTW